MKTALAVFNAGELDSRLRGNDGAGAREWKINAGAVGWLSHRNRGDEGADGPACI